MTFSILSETHKTPLLKALRTDGLKIAMILTNRNHSGRCTSRTYSKKLGAEPEGNFFKKVPLELPKNKRK